MKNRQLRVPFRRSPVTLADKYGLRPWAILTILGIVLVCVIAVIVILLSRSSGSPGERPVVVPIVVQG